ncbi:hypothetical protein [Dactylosporangium sp. CS-033363]|uniref:hypothetical protein n=1 Tax=Dactylosporangium sp. CS-033363 TaxID=3239935 RepID=UPI003D8A3776
MQVVSPPSRLRRSVRRLAMAVCALIIGAGFTPALPSTVDPQRPAAVSLHAAPAVAQESTVDSPQPAALAAPAAVTADLVLPDGRSVGAVAGRAPPPHLA